MATEKRDVGPRIGADPEVFLAKTPEHILKSIASKEFSHSWYLSHRPPLGKSKEKVQIVPACGLIGGTKYEPKKLNKDELVQSGIRFSFDPKGVGDFAIQEDNVMFEFNVPAVSRSDYFLSNLTSLLTWAETHVLAEHNLEFAWTNRHRFLEKQLTHPSAKVVGCDPDFCAYLPKGAQGRPPFDITALGEHRFCGGHIHVQYDVDKVPRDVFARFMDIAVGLANIRNDKQGNRRKFYGKAGLFRPTSYGIEYRTPSNSWLSPQACMNNVPKYIAQNVLSLAGVANTASEELAELYQKVPWPEVEKAINREDAKLGDQLVGYLANKVPFEWVRYD